jgi:hypothetical protein
VIRLVSPNPICAQCGARREEDNKGRGGVFFHQVLGEEVLLHSGCEELWRGAHGISAEPLSAEGPDDTWRSDGSGRDSVDPPTNDKRLDKWAPNWRNRCQLVSTGIGFKKRRPSIGWAT